MSEDNVTEAEVLHVNDDTVLGRSGSGHWVVMDSAIGESSGTSPMELLLISMGGCTQMDTFYILRKMKVHYQKFRIKLRGEKRDEHPKGYTKVHLTYEFWGDVPRDKVEKAARLSMERYCGATWVFRGRADVDWDVVIHPPEEMSSPDIK